MGFLVFLPKWPSSRASAHGRPWAEKEGNTHKTIAQGPGARGQARDGQGRPWASLGRKGRKYNQNQRMYSFVKLYIFFSPGRPWEEKEGNKHKTRARGGPGRPWEASLGGKRKEIHTKPRPGAPRGPGTAFDKVVLARFGLAQLLKIPENPENIFKKTIWEILENVQVLHPTPKKSYNFFWGRVHDLNIFQNFPNGFFKNLFRIFRNL